MLSFQGGYILGVPLDRKTVSYTSGRAENLEDIYIKV